MVSLENRFICWPLLIHRKIIKVHVMICWRQKWRRTLKVQTQILVTVITVLRGLLVLGLFSTSKVHTTFTTLSLMTTFIIILDKLDAHSIDIYISANFLTAAVGENTHKLLGSHEIHIIIHTTHRFCRKT